MLVRFKFVYDLDADVKAVLCKGLSSLVIDQELADACGSRIRPVGLIASSGCSIPGPLDRHIGSCDSIMA